MFNSLPIFVIAILVFGNATALYVMINHLRTVYNTYIDMRSRQFTPIIAKIHSINDDYETVPNATLLGPIALIKVSYSFNKQRYLQDLRINLRSELELLRTSEEMTIFVDNANPNLILSPLTYKTLTNSDILFDAVFQDVAFLSLFLILFNFPFYTIHSSIAMVSLL